MIGLLAASAPEARGEYANGTRERNGNSQLSHGCQSTASHRQNGVVYTPSMLADFVAAKLTSLYLTDQLRRYAISTERLDISNLRILDPACGEGALLAGMLDALANAGVRRVLPKVFCGVDIDRHAVRRAREQIRTMCQKRFRRNGIPPMIEGNTLLPRPTLTTLAGWEALKAKFDALTGFDIIIANPPWGAAIEAYRDKLSTESFTLLRGQFDTSDLFLELGLSLLKPGGFLGFIVPDSLFSYERSELRRLLVRNTEIRFLGRFGEKLFDGVNRACAVLICTKQLPAKSTRVRCVRLTPDYRKAILSGKKTFEHADRALGYEVLQSRFARNAQFRFDLDLRPDENVTISKLQKPKLRFRDVVHSTRGVELSKRGRVQKCATCRLWFPFQERATYLCPHCGFESTEANCSKEAIITREPTSGHEPIIVGECVGRYRLAPAYWINTKRPGINYKDLGTYRGPKILVRKTGVGISATIDYSRALTNQVVYIFRVKEEYRNQIPLEVLLAILNSRAMYYYVAKTHGETEWRSHPYVTQQQILELPLPNIGSLISDSAKRVASLLRTALTGQLGVLPALDSRIERFVARAFRLGPVDYTRIYQTLSTVEQLLPVQALVRIGPGDIFTASI